MEDLHDQVVEDESQRDSGEDESIWGSQDIRTRYFWDRPTLEDGALVSVGDKSECEDSGVGAESLTTMSVRTDDKSEDGGAGAQSLTMESKDDQ